MSNILETVWRKTEPRHTILPPCGSGRIGADLRNSGLGPVGRVGPGQGSGIRNDGGILLILIPNLVPVF